MLTRASPDARRAPIQTVTKNTLLKIGKRRGETRYSILFLPATFGGPITNGYKIFARATTRSSRAFCKARQNEDFERNAGMAPPTITAVPDEYKCGAAAVFPGIVCFEASCSRRTTMEEERFHLLVVDDQRDIRDPLATYLKKRGFRVTSAADARMARDALLRNAIDLIVLDIMMPREDGTALCREVVATSGVPIIFLTAMADARDRVSGLELGADDYVVKPFEPRELVARIKTVLRRTNMLPPKQNDNDRVRKLAFDGWVFDLERRELVNRRAVSMPLSTADFRLLEVFVRRPHIVLTRDQLLELTAGRAPQPFDRSIDNQVSRLRKKIEVDPRRPAVIKTVRRDGYVFATDVRAAKP